MFSSPPNKLQLTCYHAWNNQWKYDQLQHSHQDLSWESKILLVQTGERSVFSDHDTQADPWKVGRKAEFKTEWDTSASRVMSNVYIYLESAKLIQSYHNKH